MEKCSNCSSEAIILMKEILDSHPTDGIKNLPIQKMGQYIIDVYKGCLSATKGASTHMPDIEKYK